MHTLDLKIPPVVVAAFAALLIWMSDRLLPGLTGASSLARPLAVLLAVAGIGCALAGVQAFRTAQTTVNPHHPERTSAMVTSGIYAHSRNPMYLGIALVLAGYAAFMANLAGGLVVPLFVLYMTRFQIMPEERVLATKFGSAFTAYCNRTGRWLRLSLAR